MSKWSEHSIHEKLVEILASVSYPHHFEGRPFITAYQLAIEFANRFPDTLSQLDMPIGGDGLGQPNSLVQYLANELSRRIKAHTVTDIEGSFLANLNLHGITFDAPDGVITSSLTGSSYPVSMYRLKSVLGSDAELSGN